MAKGIFTQSGSITTNTDTAATATPAAGERIYVLELNLSVSVAGTTSRLIVADGVGGAPIVRMSTVAADAVQTLYFSTGDKNVPGLPLTCTGPTVAGTVLNINTTGGAAATVNYNCVYQVR